jgi:hypothetical protein
MVLFHGADQINVLYEYYVSNYDAELRIKTYVIRACIYVIDGCSVVSCFPAEDCKQEDANAQEDCEQPKHPSPSKSLGDNPGK